MILKNKQLSFRDVFTEYYPAVCAYIHNFVQNAVDKEDIVQEVFYHVWQHYDCLNDENKEYIIYKTAKQKVADFFRERIPRTSLNQSNLICAPETEECNSDILFQMKELYHLLEKLPERRKKIFILHKLEGYDYKQISKIYNISTSAVGNQISKALKFLKAEMADY